MWKGLKIELKEARKKEKVNIKEFLYDYDISRTHFYGVLSGERIPGEETKKGLAKLLNVSVEYIDNLIKEGMLEDNTDTPDVKQEHPNRKLLLYLVPVVASSILMTLVFSLGRNETSMMPKQKNPKIQGDNSSFIKDVTIPDGSFVLANKAFKKIWRVKNTGVIHWKDRFLKRINPSVKEGCFSKEMVTIEDTLPNEEVDITAYIKPPSTSGTCITYWKITDVNGVPFFQNSKPLYSEVNVTIYNNMIK